MSDIQNKNITISAVEQKTAKNGNAFFKLKDENNLTYTMWTTKKDGSKQPCFAYFETLGFNSIGKSVSIGFKEDHGEYEGKAVTYRTIIGMREPSANDMPQATQAPVSDLESRVKSLELRLSVLEGKKQMVDKVAVAPATPFDEVTVDQIPF